MSNGVDLDASLPEPARDILVACRRLLARGGTDALTLQAIAEEAGQPKASIGYYFGNKQRLIATLVDSLVHDSNVALLRRVHHANSMADRLPAIVAAQRAALKDEGSLRAFFDILPRAARDKELRSRLADSYAGYHQEVILQALGAETEGQRAQYEPLAVLMLAVVDGMAVQYILRGASFDGEAAYALWEDLLQVYVKSSPPASDS